MASLVWVRYWHGVGLRRHNRLKYMVVLMNWSPSIVYVSWQLAAWKSQDVEWEMVNNTIDTSTLKAREGDLVGVIVCLALASQSWRCSSGVQHWSLIVDDVIRWVAPIAFRIISRRCMDSNRASQTHLLYGWTSHEYKDDLLIPASIFISVHSYTCRPTRNFIPMLI